MSKTPIFHRKHTRFDRFLSVFATVRPREGWTASLLALNVFLLLAAYYIIKPVREALILGESSAEVKSYAGAIQAMLFIVIVPLYGYIASRVNRIWLINGVTAFFASNLVMFYFLGRQGFSISIPFFLWVGLFNLMLVAQFWIFANDLYTEEQGKRLFAIVGIGSSLGAIIGARVAGTLFEPIGAYSMMLVAASILVVCIVLTNWIHQREQFQSKVAAKRPAPLRTDVSERLDRSGGFQLIFNDRYLLLIAALVLLSNLVNTTGEFILGKTVEMHAETAAAAGIGVTAAAYIGEFYSSFYFWVNLISAVLQMFVVSRVMKYIGVRPALLILPFLALGCYALIAFLPVLGFIRFAKILENSADYSIQNTARHALFLTTSREAKYKAKAAIDTFFWRTGDALSGLVVLLGTQLAFSMGNFAIVNTVLVLAWLIIAFGIVRLRNKETRIALQAA